MPLPFSFFRGKWTSAAKIERSFLAYFQAVFFGGPLPPLAVTMGSQVSHVYARRKREEKCALFVCAVATFEKEGKVDN